jgi:hypothetical protein
MICAQELPVDVVYTSIAKFAIESWSYGRTFVLETWYPEVELRKKAAALFRAVHIMSRK